LAGTLEGVNRGFSGVYPSQPPPNPLSTPYEPPMKYNVIMKKKNRKSCIKRATGYQKEDTVQNIRKRCFKPTFNYLELLIIHIMSGLKDIDCIDRQSQAKINV